MSGACQRGHSRSPAAPLPSFIRTIPSASDFRRCCRLPHSCRPVAQRFTAWRFDSRACHVFVTYRRSGIGDESPHPAPKVQYSILALSYAGRRAASSRRGYAFGGQVREPQSRKAAASATAAAWLRTSGQDRRACRCSRLLRPASSVHDHPTAPWPSGQ